MDERLDLMKIDPRRVLDAGCGARADSRRLRARYPRCAIVAVDDVVAEFAAFRVKHGLINRILAGIGLKSGLGAGCGPWPVVGTFDRLPCATASVDLVWSNLALHRQGDPLPVLREMHRVLAAEGLLMFSTLGPDTLAELRRSFATADPGSPHVHDFIDMHDLGDMLVASGFAAPVMDMETLTLTYEDVMSLARDLKGMGGANALIARRHGLSGRALWNRLRDAYEPLRRNGRLPATFEIVYGHAWKPRPRVSSATETLQVVKFHPSVPIGTAT